MSTSDLHKHVYDYLHTQVTRTHTRTHKQSSHKFEAGYLGNKTKQKASWARTNLAEETAGF